MVCVLCAGSKSRGREAEEVGERGPQEEEEGGAKTEEEAERGGRGVA